MEKPNTYYLQLIWRYWLVVIVATVLAAVISYILYQRQPVLYESEVKLIVGDILAAPDPQLGQIEPALRLAPSYAEFVRSYEILSTALQTSGSAMDVESLSKAISVEIVSETTIIVIKVQSIDPQEAADIANAIAQTLIIQSPQTALSLEQQEQLARLQQQILDLESLIQITDIQFQQVLTDLDATSDEELETQLTARAALLTNQLNSSHATLANLEKEYQDLSNRSNRIEIIEDARPNYDSLGLNPIIAGAAGGFIGLSGIIAGLVIVDFFDVRMRSAEDVKRRLNLPMLGSVTHENWTREHFYELVNSGKLMDTKTMEEFRAILTAMLFDASRPPMSDLSNQFAIVSPSRGNGRSFVSICLAMAAADYGLKVLLVDADGQTPTIHECFGILNSEYAMLRMLDFMSQENETVANGKVQIADLHDKIVNDNALYSKLKIVASGRVPSLQQRRIPLLKSLKTFLDQSRETQGYDIVLIDTSASLGTSDALNLVAITESRVLLVLESKVSTLEEANKTIESYARVGYAVEGIVLNGV